MQADLGQALGETMGGQSFSGGSLIAMLFCFFAVAIYAFTQGDTGNNDDDDSTPGGGLMQPVA